MDIYKFAYIVYKMIIKYLQLTVNSFLRFNLLFFFCMLLFTSFSATSFAMRRIFPVYVLTYELIRYFSKRPFVFSENMI